MPFALVGGQAVALWVTTRSAAVRTTKDVDLLLQRSDLPAPGGGAPGRHGLLRTSGSRHVSGTRGSHPRHAVHLVWAGEKVRPEYELPSPQIEERQELSAGLPVVSLPGLVPMKLLSYRDRDRVHLTDMIEVGLIDRDMLATLTPELGKRLEVLLSEAGR